MKRTTVSLLVAAGLVLSSAIARPATRASADTLHCDVGLSIVLNILGVAPVACGFGLDSGTGTNCSLTNVDVNVNPTTGAHDYQWDFTAGTIGPCNMHVQGDFNPTTKRADEQLKGDSGRVQATWTCSDDPWVFLPGQAPFCQNTSLLATNSDGSAGDVPSMTFPVSAQTLRDSDRHVLNAQLQNALNQAQQSAPVAPQQTRVSNNCVTCVLSSAAIPTLPDFTIRSIIGTQQPTQGFTYTYDVILANLGAAPSGQVQVQISVSGSLRYLQMAQTPAGWTCLGNTSPITCTGPLGGVGAPPTSVEFQLQAQAAQTGIGSISAYADPNNVIQESNENNNAQTLPVTVK